MLTIRFLLSNSFPVLKSLRAFRQAVFRDVRIHCPRSRNESKSSSLRRPIPEAGPSTSGGYPWICFCLSLCVYVNLLMLLFFFRFPGIVSVRDPFMYFPTFFFVRPSIHYPFYLRARINIEPHREYYHRFIRNSIPRQLFKLDFRFPPLCHRGRRH